MECKKIKVLCLHGFRQNKYIFKQKIGFLRKMFKNYVDFVALDSPHALENSIGDDVGTRERSWWFTGPNQTYVSKLPSDIDDGFDDSIKHIQTFINVNGPFDGLFGFSQGAALAALISLLIERKEFQADFKFVILVAGFKSLCKPHLPYYSVKVTMPSLHIIGDTDNVISKEQSEELMSFFDKCEVIRHPGGHYVPGGKEFKEHYMNFFKSI